jgi:hypothetical protein
MKTMLLLLFISLILPFPTENTPILKIARSIDQNEVHYFVNVDNQGDLIQDEPLKLLWKNHKKGGKYEDLNWIKKKYGYGIKMLNKSKNKIHFQFVSYNKKQFFLQKNRNGNYAIFMDFDNKEVELTDVFVNIQGGSFWAPNVVSVGVKGHEVSNYNAFLGELKMK